MPVRRSGAHGISRLFWLGRASRGPLRSRGRVPGQAYQNVQGISLSTPMGFIVSPAIRPCASRRVRHVLDAPPGRKACENDAPALALRPTTRYSLQKSDMSKTYETPKRFTGCSQLAGAWNEYRHNQGAQARRRSRLSPLTRTPPWGEQQTLWAVCETFLEHV